jgi:NAD(P)-dependent dehydrogenase (short-subunit alcohol dehydrogenase family)
MQEVTHSFQQRPKESRPRTALVIGGGRGIGRAAGLELARRGFDVVLAARHPEEIERTAEEVRETGRRALAIVADVTEEDSIRRLFAEVNAFSDRLDMLVNSAGAAFLGQLSATTPDIFESLVQVNLIGPYRCIYHASELLRRSAGHVINIISRAGRVPYGNALGYGSAKSALVYLTRALSQELARDGVRINAVSPGAVATALRREVFPEEDQSSLMKAEAVAEIIGQMTEAAFSNVTGAVIDVPW